MASRCSRTCENGPIAGLLDKRLAFVTGKGGVGKTTVSYALGLAAAAAGKRAIVCEIARQEHGSALFGRDPIGFNETELSDGLWAISIDPDKMVREYLEVLLPVRAMASLLYRSNLFAYLAAATPGLQEVVSIGKAYELTLDVRRSPDGAGTYDLVIVDAPATGHGIGFLEAPGTFRRIAKGGPLADQASRIERMITDREQSGVGIVATAEEMAVNETAELAEGLDETGVALEEVFVNGLFPERFSTAELERIRIAREQRPSAALDAAIAEAERAQTQRIELDRLRGIVTGVPIDELPFLFAAELGVAELRRIASVLA
ncbi:MAG TPA: ArsA family ATPase [Solirubrobacterales bacterium]|nr:ArsA family ATPase [Solirubrobacterales bacterium]